MLSEIHDRPQSIVIERLPYSEFIRRYDRLGALFYLDPPYWACETDYGPDVFKRDNFAALAAQLAGIEGKFLMSLNDTAGLRETISRFALTSINMTYKIGGESRTFRELFISNYAPISNDNRTE